VNQSNKWLIGFIPAAMVAGATLWEGTRYIAYRDIVGVPTVCQGYTGKDIVFGKKYSPEECKVFLTKELKAHTEGMLKCIKVPINESQYIAYGLFTYNVGVGAFCGSTALKLLNQKKFTESCNALLNWTYAGGKFVQGLQNRRQYEAAICKQEPYVQ
jgi:lysozyme